MSGGRIATLVCVIAAGGCPHGRSGGPRGPLTATTPAGPPRAVWALDDGTKVAATALDHPLERRNGIFDGRRIELFAARNETVAFQLIIEGGDLPTRGMRARLDRVGTIANGPLRRDPDAYFVGRRIELFAQHYLRVARRSHDLAWRPGSAAEPPGGLGWLPDALIPLRDGERFSVPARRNQGLWIDIYVPKSTAPGVHRGTLELTIDGQPCTLPTCRLPIALRVLPVTLPDVPTIKTMLYFSGGDNDRDQMLARYVRKPWSRRHRDLARRLRDRHYKLARRHRLTLFNGDQKWPDPTLAARLSGRAFTRAAGYEGPGEGVGQDVYSIHSYGGTLTADEARVWSGWFARHGHGARYFLYAADEPGRSAFARINAVARRARPVSSFVTHDFVGALDAVSIFCALADGYRPSHARAAARAGRRLWIYNGVRPFSGSFVIDDSAVSPRVNAWIQHKYGIERWFYWESTYYKDEQGGRGPIDVFGDPVNYSNRDGDRMNGDGLLIYPGRDMLFAHADRGVPLPLPSIRLKNWRRGIEDVEYLVLARRAGHAAAVGRLIESMVPRALADETRAGQAVAWSEDGERWLAARRQLAALLSQNTGADIR